MRSLEVTWNCMSDEDKEVWNEISAADKARRVHLVWADLMLSCAAMPKK